MNTTPVHAHTALFGVYGLLSLGLVVVIARMLTPGRAWREQPLAVGFWCMNLGLALMVALSLLPIGLAQAWASVEHGLWFARSAEFLQQPIMEGLRWLRIIGDTVFLVGVASFAWFMAGLVGGWSYVGAEEPGKGPGVFSTTAIPSTSRMAHADTVSRPQTRNSLPLSSSQLPVTSCQRT